MMNEIIQQLKQYRVLETDEDFNNFGAALLAYDDLPEKEQYQHLRDLFTVFYDDTGRFDGMAALMELVETYEEPYYSDALLAATPEMLTDGREWAVRLHERLLNSDLFFPDLARALAQAPADVRDGVTEFMDTSLREHLNTIRETHEAKGNMAIVANAERNLVKLDALLRGETEITGEE